MATSFILFILAVAFCSSILITVLSYEPAPLQDFCVADATNQVFRLGTVRVNGMACKNPLFVQADDFYYSGLHVAGDTQNSYGYRISPVSVYQIPGLNTLGLSMMRIDYALWGANPPHTHPRATEILTVLEGTLQVGFITSDPQNRLITKVLQRGDVFVFPVGLVHFQRNMGHTNATAIAALSSQNPGVISITNSIFGSTPPISTEILAQAFQVDNKTVHLIKKKLMHM
ncbi:putative germin-like protein 2-3 isoform X1 [Bidens hawaiensis]|uniref:putative germin-like protein 2-3 isoform X1 n=1 Tax=Bidens hawaiensis TaxID=980011 RepID=UPI00404A88CC